VLIEIRNFDPLCSTIGAGEGCLDLSKAGEMGFEEAYELIRKLCN